MSCRGLADNIRVISIAPFYLFRRPESHRPLNGDVYLIATPATKSENVSLDSSRDAIRINVKRESLLTGFNKKSSHKLQLLNLFSNFSTFR